MTVFYDVEQPSEEEDTRAQQSLISTVTLILPLEATTVNNPSNSSGVTAGEIAGVTAGVKAAAAEKQWSDGGITDINRYPDSTS